MDPTFQISTGFNCFSFYGCLATVQ